MAGKSDVFETALLAFLFNKSVLTGFEGIFANPAVPLDYFYVALHSSDPGETATDQTVNEISYGDYARVQVARASGTFTYSGNSVHPVASIDFPMATSGSVVASHFSIGTTASGSSGEILYSGAITPNISIVTNTIPRLTTASVITED